ncbi:photosystem I assembly protein Ycf3 [Stieleria neptunia]|uniref:Photosystem I assembly protein Ycf3 n=1 Tax=Stieleria neptunia TaxID=2527979 RepID=A0A518I1P2_9BACT|nr:tetratricopeptide repeat protein [Stieleria neptunia]QDV47033.1 photosystem I assembly protein Ycf3 [Stieleria neptunia]
MTERTKTFRNRRRNQLHSALAASLVIGSAAATTGCSSSLGPRVASLNPFSSAPATPSGEATGSNWLSGPKNVSTSLASGAKGAASKSRTTVASWFGRGDKTNPDVTEGDATDPTSLTHKAEVTPEVFVANGRLWESTGNYEKAMESYAKALEKRPDDAAALANIARLHFRQENHQKAAEYFGKAIQQNSNDAGLYNDLGLTLSKLGNHSAAAATIEQALRLSPGSSRYANNLASVKFQAGDPSGALEVLVQNNKPAVAHFNMAYLHYKHGQKAESTRHLNQALAYEPQAASDAATKRAVERSRELLAQIGNVPGATPGVSMATAAQPAANAPAANAPANTAVQQAAQGFTPGTDVPGFQNAIRPASTANTNVSFGNASYKTPAPSSGVNQTSASVPAPTAAPTAGDQGSSGKFALPPNFSMPQ